ncbi:MAG: PAS domain S-box protein, partial [Burkholderiaceae bacterium]
MRDEPSPTLRLIAPDVQRLHELLDRLPVGVVLIDPQLVALFWSARCESLFGWRADEVVGRPIVQSFSRGLERGVEWIRDSVRAQHDAGAAGVVESETQIQTRDGAVLMCRFTTIALRDAHGALAGLLSVAQDVTAQAAAQRALRISEEQFRTLFEHNPQAMCVTEVGSLRFLAVNEAATRRYGWSREEFLSKRLPDICAPGQAPDLGQSSDASGSMMEQSGPLRHCLSDGRVIDVECVSRALSFQGHEAWLTCGFDVTARERALSELRDSEHRLDTLMRNLPVGVFLADTKGACEYVNPRWELLTGLTAAQALGEGWVRVVHEDDLAKLRSAWRRAIEHAESASVEFRVRHVDASVRWVLGHGYALRGADGSLTGFVGSWTDLSERHAAEEQLRIAATAFELQEGILVNDSEGIVLRVNRAFTEITGYAAHEVVGRTTQWLQSEPEELELRRQRRAAVHAKGHWSGEVFYRRKNGERFAAWVSIAAVRDEQGRISHFVGSLIDVTERKRSETALLESQRELGQLTQRLMEQEKQTTKKLAQALHDRLGQTLAAVRLQTDALAAQNAAGGPLQAQQTTLQRVRSLLDEAVREVRAVLVDLRPPALDELGLVAALDNELQVRLRDAGEVELRLQAEAALRTRRWPADVEYAAFMVAREAIGNALRHAHATRITCRLDGEALRLRLRVV